MLNHNSETINMVIEIKMKFFIHRGKSPPKIKGAILIEVKPKL